MNQRDVFLKEFRGQTIGTVSNESSTDELFQNEVLRPILKLQNDIFIQFFPLFFKQSPIAILCYYHIIKSPDSQ